MKLSKRILAISLALAMVIMPVASLADNFKTDNDIKVAESEQKDEYTEFKGEIKSVNLEKGKGTILVQGENEEMVFHVNDEVFVTDMRLTKENKIMNLEEGAKVNVFYPSNTPVSLSMPAQLTPEVIVVNNADMQVKVDKFNEDLLSSDGNLVLNVEDEEKEIYKNKTLLVFYSVSTESLPEQTVPELVTILNEDREVEDKVVGEFTRFEGKIEESNIKEDQKNIHVKTDDGTIVFNISDDTFITDMNPTKENKMVHLVKNQNVIVYSKSNKPMTTSMPPQTTPDVIIIDNGDLQVKVDKFDENLISSDNQLQLKLEDDGEKKKYIDQELLVFYKESTKSIPAQTTPLDITILNKDEAVEKEEITELNKIKVNGKDVKLNMYKKPDGMVMIPIRKLSDSLGYNLEWTSNNEPIEINKGAQWTSFKIGENKYSFGKMAPFKLSYAPELKKGTTYVPFDFLVEVFKMENIEIIEGVLNI